MIATSLRRQTLQVMSRAIMDRLRLAQTPTVVAAPPSEAPEYPAAALQLDKFRLIADSEDEIQGDEDGPLLGARASLSSYPAVQIGDGAYLSRVGSVVGDGRIWVGARLPAQREAMESRITRLFFDEQMAPSRWLITIPNPTIDDYTLPFSWTVAAFIDDIEWTQEYVFSERLWSWMKYQLEIEILIPRDFPLVKKFNLEFDVDHTQPFDENGVFDRDDGADSEFYEIPPLKQIS